MRQFVTTALMIVSLLALTTVQAKELDFWNVLGKSKGKSTLPGGEFVYLTSDAKARLWIGINFSEFMNEGKGGIDLTGFKADGQLNRAELTLLADEVVKVSEECFNVSASRNAEIRDWIIGNKVGEAHFYQTAMKPVANRNFGPLQLSLMKTVNGGSHSVTVFVSREGKPGVAPWTQTCVASG